MATDLVRSLKGDQVRSRKADRVEPGAPSKADWLVIFRKVKRGCDQMATIGKAVRVDGQVIEKSILSTIEELKPIS